MTTTFNTNIKYYEDIKNVNDWHDTYSLQLGELIDDGLIDFNLPEWDFDSFNDEQRNRFYKKLTERYYTFELGFTPYKLWKIELLRTINETMPKLKPLYQMQADDITPFSSGTEYGKERGVFSDFPQTRLSSQNQDYASNANDKEYFISKTGSILDTWELYQDMYKDPDVVLLDAVKTCFSGLVSQTLAVY